MFLQNFIKLSAAVHELSWAQAFLPYLAMVKNRKSGPVTLTFDLRLEIQKVSSSCQYACSCKIFIKLSAAVHELSGHRACS